MAFTEFYCDASAGANINGGSDAGSPSMSDTAGTGAVSTVTHQYTSVATTGSVAVGQFISIYSGAATVSAFTARITVVTGGSGSAWVITYSTTAKSGTEPTTGASYKAQVGGSLKGPNAAESFPFGFITAAQTNAAGDTVRVNFKNGTNYAITSTMTHSIGGVVTFEGYTTNPGDGGKAIIDGGTSGVSFILLTVSGNFNVLRNIIFQNNGASASASGLVLSGANVAADLCVVNSVRGIGMLLSGASLCQALSCEVYAANQSNTASLGGYHVLGAGVVMRNCIAHDNTGSNTAGCFIGAGGSPVFIGCIFDTSGSHGVSISAVLTAIFFGCEFYSNGGDGVRAANSTAINYTFFNCNFIKNTGWGFNGSGAGQRVGRMSNCGFGSGTQVNGSGDTTGLSGIMESGKVTYASGVTPWIDPANGDFRISLAAAQGTGYGVFTETASGYAGTIGYPDIGAAQHLQVAGGMTRSRTV